MRNVNQESLRQSNLLTFSASWRCYPGNLGTHTGRDGAKLIIFSPINIADSLIDAAYLLDGCEGGTVARHLPL